MSLAYHVMLEHHGGVHVAKPWMERFGDDSLIADALRAGGAAKKVEADLRRVEKESIM